MSGLLRRLAVGAAGLIVLSAIETPRAQAPASTTGWTPELAMTARASDRCRPIARREAGRVRGS